MKNLIRIIFCLSLAAVIAFCLAACGGDDASETDFTIDWSTENPFYGETLTIGTTQGFFNEEAFARTYMRANPGTTIEIINYGQISDHRGMPIAANIEAITARVGMQMMTGTAPTLLTGVLVDYRNLNTALLLTDWAPIMEAHPGFYEDEWDMNFFEAMSVNGQMFAFPATYSFNYIVANSQVPGLVEAFSQYDSISLWDMVELYEQFAPQYRSMYLFSEMDIFYVVWSVLHDFLDLQSDVVDFDNQAFIDLITWARDNTPPREIRRHLQVLHTEDRGNTHGAELFFSQHYLFRTIPVYFFEYFPVLESDTIFLNPLPVVNANGDLVAWVNREYVLNAGATPIQQLLALDFMMFMNNPDDVTMWLAHRDYYGNIPTNNPKLQFTAETTFLNMINQYFTGPSAHTQHQMAVSREEAVVMLYEEMARIREMPKADSRFAPQMIRDTLSEILGQFQDGLITAEQAAQDLQNRLTLILMEM